MTWPDYINGWVRRVMVSKDFLGVDLLEESWLAVFFFGKI